MDDRRGNLIRDVGERVKFAVERSRAEDAARQSADRHRLRVEIGDALQSLDTPAQIMAIVAQRLGEYLRTDQANYYVIDRDHFVVANEWHSENSAGMPGRHLLTAFPTSTRKFLQGGKTVRIDDTSLVEGADVYAQFNMRAVMSIPLQRDGQWLAGLHVHQAQPRAWTDDEEALMREIAAYVWAAMERAQAQQELRALNETLETLVAERSAERDQLWSLSQDMLARADFTGMMSAVSPAWGRVLGWTESDLLSRGYATFMHPDDMPPTLAAIGQMAATHQPTRFENRIATRDGGWKDIEWIVAPEADGQNFIAVGRDMSLVKAKENALIDAQEQLRQSQKLEAMGQLTGGVAHDFNNLLTPIIGSLDMLMRRGLGNDRERRLIDGALQSAERAKLLVQRLLAFARRQPLQPTAVDVANLVNSMTGLIGSTLGPNTAIKTDFAADLPRANADQNQIEMALLNLAVNARDAMPEGGELTISLRLETAAGDAKAGLSPGHYICMRVIDTGTGMDAVTLARAIEPFFSTKGIGKGTGLGLSMVHGLAAQLGGALTIKSEVNHGTTVELWLPVTTDVAEVEAAAQEDAVTSSARGRALLVDDEFLVRMTTRDMLEDLGFEVAEAATAEEALQLIGQGTEFDILITDHLMPGMSGAELVQQVRRTMPGLPVVIVSGYADVEGIAPDLPRLTKPYRNADLATLLATLLPAQNQT